MSKTEITPKIGDSCNVAINTKTNGGSFNITQIQQQVSPVNAMQNKGSQLELALAPKNRLDPHPKPTKKWYSFSLKGLLDAAKYCLDLGKTLFNLLTKTLLVVGVAYAIIRQILS